MFCYIVAKILIFWFYFNFEVNNVDGAEISRTNRHYNMGEFECPFPYAEVHDMCLYAGSCSNTYNYTAARAFCQTIKGGDLAFYRDLNEFDDIIGYLQLVEPGRTCNFWLGASFVKTIVPSSNAGIWQWVRPDVPPLLTTDLSWALGQPDGIQTQHYLFMSKDAFYRVDDGIANEAMTTALCRLVPKRKNDDIIGYQISYPSSHEIY